MNRFNPKSNYEYLVEQLVPDGEPTIRFVYRAKNFIDTSEGKLGVLSGSFNPLTLAHLKIIELAENQKGLNELLLLLAKANVDKNVFGATLSQRLTILECYAKTRDNLSVAVSSHGRFVDKVSALKVQDKLHAPLYPPDTQIYFLIGYDTLVRVFDRKYYSCMDKELSELFDQCEFIVTNRGENGISLIENFLSQPSRRKYAGKIHAIRLKDRYAQMSSTKVRKQVKSGLPIDGLVPQIVLEWIENTGVYS